MTLSIRARQIARDAKLPAAARARVEQIEIVLNAYDDARCYRDAQVTLAEARRALLSDAMTDEERFVVERALTWAYVFAPAGDHS